MMKKTGLYVCIFVSLICLCSCTDKFKSFVGIKTIPTHKILIAGAKTDFKESLKEKIIERYKEKCTTHVLEFDKLKTIDLSSYDAILMMDSCLEWTNYEPVFRPYLNMVHNREKVVLFITASDTSSQFSYKDIDAITAASYIENEEMALKRISEKIDRLLTPLKK